MLPLIFAFLLVIVQAGVVVRDQVLLVHAVREAARAASLDLQSAAPPPQGLATERLRLDVSRQGSLVTVEGSYRSPVFVPLLRFARDEVELLASVSMRVEFDAEGSAP